MVRPLPRRVSGLPHRAQGPRFEVLYLVAMVSLIAAHKVMQISARSGHFRFDQGRAAFAATLKEMSSEILECGAFGDLGHYSRPDGHEGLGASR